MRDSRSTTARIISHDGGGFSLLVGGKPFLILGGELGNSTAADRPAMAGLWPRLKAMGLNTALVPVYWEQLEPEEGRLDFSWIDEDIRAARANGMRMVPLWFATWKNSMSCYVPPWVKQDQKRFPRLRDENGMPQDILSPHGKETLSADSAAFKALMTRVEEADRGHDTVIMVQVENEMGIIPCARDHSPLAEEAWKGPIDDGLRQLLGWKAGSWAEHTRTMDGAGLAAVEEIFSAWHLALFAEGVTKAGKEAHQVPMYVNAALPRKGALPGQYPAGGPLPHLMNVWKRAAPSVDLLSPDIYTSDFTQWCDEYAVPGNPLFIPEHMPEAAIGAKAIYCVVEKGSFGFSPFSIENLPAENAAILGGAYSLLQEIAPRLETARSGGKPRPRAAILDAQSREAVFDFDGLCVHVGHELLLPWKKAEAAGTWPSASVIIIRTGPLELIVAGTGFYAEFTDEAGHPLAFLTADRGHDRDGAFMCEQRLNGDETHQGRHARIPTGSFWVQMLRLYTLQ